MKYPTFYTHLKRFTRFLLLFGLVAGISLTLYSRYLVNYHANNRAFKNINRVPYRNTALVLGCSRYTANGRLNLYFQHRINAASQLYHAGKVRQLLVSGDNSSIDYNEALMMKNALIAQGVPAQSISCDYAGFRTLDSVVRAKAIFQLKSFTIVSQADHCGRAIYIAQANDIDVVAYCAEDIHLRRYRFKNDLRESLARVKMLLDIHIFHTEPKFYGPKINILQKATTS